MEKKMLDNLDNLFSGMFSDELDKMGYSNQVIFGMNLNNKNKMYGPARTLTIQIIETDDENIKTGLNFLNSLDQGDILCVKGSKEYSYFGEIMTRLSTRQGLSGVVIDGLTRDSHYTKEADLPIFSKGYSPKDIKGRGRVDKTNVQIDINNVKINPGDYIFGDSDGLVVIPKSIKYELELRLLNLLNNENNLKKDIYEGKPIGYILDKYKEF